MQVTVEFVDEEATRYDFRIKIKTSNQDGEQEIDYGQLREIDRVLQPHNAEASGLFPRFKMWSRLLINQPQTEDLKKLEQVSAVPLSSFLLHCACLSACPSSVV
jgi:hypothetical protein